MSSFRFNYILLAAIFLLTSCAGAGSTTDGRGLGIEGTGFKTFIKGQVVNTDGDAISGATVSTDDASTSTDAAGQFLLESSVSQDESVSIMVETPDAVSGTAQLDPVRLEPGDSIEVTISVDEKTGKVSVEDQATVKDKKQSEETINQHSDQTVTQVQNTVEKPYKNPSQSSVERESELDPNLVDL